VSEFLESFQKFLAENSSLELLIAVLSITVGFFSLSLFIRELPKTLEPLRKSLLSVSEVTDLFVKKQIETISSKKEDNLKISFEELEQFLSASNKDPFKDEDGLPIDDWKLALIQSRTRLVEETERLTSRSVVNLIVGIVISIVGIVILTLALFVFAPDETPAGFYEFSAIYLSRFLLVLSVQILAAFFLRMYVAMERDIKSNKNEITNIELRYTAGLLATDRKTSLKEIAMALANEERNSIVPKASDPKKKDKIEKQLESITKLISKIGT